MFARPRRGTGRQGRAFCTCSTARSTGATRRAALPAAGRRSQPLEPRMPARRPRSISTASTAGLAGLLALAAGCGPTPDPASPAQALAATEAILAQKGGGGGGLPDRYVLPGAAVFPEGIAV